MSELGPVEAMTALTTHEGRANPYPLYEALRAVGPVINFGPKAAVVGFEECQRALMDPKFVSPDNATRDRWIPDWQSQPAWRSICTTMLFKNEPDHSRLRRFSSAPFSPTRIAELRPAIERIAESAVDKLAKLGESGKTVEFMENFAEWLPLSVMAEVLGIPEEDLPTLQPMMRPVTEGLDPFGDPGILTAANTAVEDLAAYYEKLVAKRRAEPGQDLISTLVQTFDAGTDLSEAELIATFMVLLVAGTAAPFDMLGNTMALAARFPEYTDEVRENPEFAAAFMEEGIRFDPAVQVLNRVAAENMDFFGVPIKEGTAVFLLIAAANRDPRRYENPDRFDPHRQNIQPLTFGIGAHYCLGSALARLEGAVALSALARRFKTIKISGETAYRNQLVQRGFSRLPVTVG